MSGRVQASTSPTVQVLTTPDLDSALARNRFRSLAHLLAPFLSQPGTERIQTRTPATYDQVTHDYFPVRLVAAAAAAAAEEPERDLPVDLFLDKVGQDIAANVDTWLRTEATTTTPWYDAVRDAVLARRDLARDLDSFDSPLATLVALSTTNPDPLNALAALWDQAAQSQSHSDTLRFILLVHDHGHPDADADWSDAQKLHDTIRKTYGLHTALVPLFSAAPTAPHPEPPAPEAALAIWNWGDADAAPPTTAHLVGLGVDETGGGQGDDDAKESPAAAQAPSRPAAELSSQDLTALATFSREFVVQSLVPFLERTAIVAHEQWIASRRSLGGRLFSVGRKYFGGGGGAGQGGGAEGGSRAASPGPAGGREGYNPTKGVYHPLSQLSQTRRLADLCLVLGDPKLAHAVYESLAKDYRADKAWRHAAAATRMAGLSSLLVYSSSAAVVEGLTTTAAGGGGGGPSPLGSANNNPDAYLVAASSLSQLAPSSSSSPADYDALRATLLYYELYRSLGSPPYDAKRRRGGACWSLASDALVRTAGEADEVVSAVLLEQAALADWKAPVGVGGGAVGSGGGSGSGSGTEAEREVRGRRRKYAFHLAMAAARYEKCGIKALSRRCLGQAATLFRPLPPSASVKPYHPDSVAADTVDAEGVEDSAPPPPPPPPLTALLDPRFPPPPRPRDSSETLSLIMPWLAIRTYMHHSLARQAYTVGDALDAVEHFLELLVGSVAAMDPTTMTTAAEATTTLSAGDWLDDFALAYSLLGDDADRLVSERGIRLPIRLFDAQNAKLAVPGTASATSHAQGAPAVTVAWDALEQDMLQRAQWQETTTGRKKRPRTISHRFSRPGEGPAAGSAAATAKASWVAPPPFEAAVGETVMLEVPVRNPLEAFLALGDVKVEIQTTDSEGKTGSTEAHATMDVELAPLERSKVYIPIQATTLGKLVVRSISYRFSGLLPVSESLAERWTTPTPARPGKPSVRNRIPLVADMHAPTPRVEVDLSALPSKLFHGEMRTVAVTFRNTGKTPITQLHFLCSHPEVVSTLASVAESAGDSREVSNSLETPPPVSLLPSARPLQPGDSLQHELIVRGDAAGRRNLQILLAFCGDSDNEVYAATGVHVLDVYPSLNVRCRARTTFTGDNPFLLDVDVHNCGLPADDVAIDGIAMFSPTWRCDADSTSWVRPGNLGWQQSTAFSVPIVGAEPVADEIDVEFVQRVQTVLQGRDSPTSPYPRIPLLHSSIGVTEGSNENLLALYAASRRSRVGNAFGMIPRERHARLFPLFSTRAAFLAIRFTSATLDLAGSKAATVIVPLDAPAIGSSAGSAGASALQKALTTAQGFAGGLYEETQRERTTLLGALGSMELLTSAASSPIQLDMQVNTNVEHDFATGPLFLPVRFCLRSTSPVANIAFSLELAGVSSHSAAPFIGALRHEGQLDPLALHVVEVQVWLSRPGVFVVGNGQLVVSTPSTAGSSWRTRLPARVLRLLWISREIATLRRCDVAQEKSVFLGEGLESQWFVNRQRDIVDGKSGHLLSNQLDSKMREDLERLKKIRNHRGLRTYRGLRVRGQHTKTTGRGGKTVGVSKKK